MVIKKKLRGFYLLLSSFIISLLSLPMAFAKTASAGSKSFLRTAPVKTLAAGSSNSVAAIRSVYDSLHLNISGLSKQAYDYAKKGFDKLVEQGKLLNDSIIAIVDFSLPSNRKRLFVVDMKNYKVLHQSLVAHGRNSGTEMAQSFSNQPESYKSSPGFYVTGDTYNGKNGYSLRLEGLEPGINDRAFERTIVMHGADYVNQEIANDRGWVGRSWGCPAVPMKDAGRIINTIKDGTCLFIYTPQASYLDHSTVLN